MPFLDSIGITRRLLLEGGELKDVTRDAAGRNTGQRAG
jgi:hypothetical protein